MSKGRATPEGEVPPLHRHAIREELVVKSPVRPSTLLVLALLTCLTANIVHAAESSTAPPDSITIQLPPVPYF